MAWAHAWPERTWAVEGAEGHTDTLNSAHNLAIDLHELGEADDGPRSHDACAHDLIAGATHRPSTA